MSAKWLASLSIYESTSARSSVNKSALDKLSRRKKVTYNEAKKHGVEAVILSVHPDAAQQIFFGKARFLFRKKLPATWVKTIYVYLTRPRGPRQPNGFAPEFFGAVIGSFQVAELFGDYNPETLWEVTKSKASISEDKYYELFTPPEAIGPDSCNAIRFNKVNLFTEPKCLSDFGSAVVPQAFQYVKELA